MKHRRNHTISLPTKARIPTSVQRRAKIKTNQNKVSIHSEAVKTPQSIELKRPIERPKQITNPNGFIHVGEPPITRVRKERTHSATYWVRPYHEKWIHTMEGLLVMSDDPDGISRRKPVPLEHIEAALLIPLVSKCTVSVYLRNEPDPILFEFENRMAATHWVNFLNGYHIPATSKGSTKLESVDSLNLFAPSPTNKNPVLKPMNPRWELNILSLSGSYIWKSIKRSRGIPRSWQARWAWVTMSPQNGPLLHIGLAKTVAAHRTYIIRSCTYVDFVPSHELRQHKARTINGMALQYGVQIHWNSESHYKPLIFCTESAMSQKVWINFFEDTILSFDPVHVIPSRQHHVNLADEVRRRDELWLKACIKEGFQYWVNNHSEILQVVEESNALFFELGMEWKEPPNNSMANLIDEEIPTLSFDISQSALARLDQWDEEFFTADIWEGVIWCGADETTPMEDALMLPVEQLASYLGKNVHPRMSAPQTTSDPVAEMMDFLGVTFKQIGVSKPKEIKSPSGSHSPRRRGLTTTILERIAPDSASVMEAFATGGFPQMYRVKSVEKARKFYPELSKNAQLLCHFKCFMLCAPAFYEVETHFLLTSEYLVLGNTHRCVFNFAAAIPLSSIVGVARYRESCRLLHNRFRLLHDGYRAWRDKFRIWKYRTDLKIDHLEQNTLLPEFENVEREVQECEARLPQTNKSRMAMNDEKNITAFRIYSSTGAAYHFYDFHVVNVQSLQQMEEVSVKKSSCQASVFAILCRALSTVHKQEKNFASISPNSIPLDAESEENGSSLRKPDEIEML